RMRKLRMRKLRMRKLRMRKLRMRKLPAQRRHLRPPAKSPRPLRPESPSRLPVRSSYLHSAALAALLLLCSGVADAADRMEPTPVELEAVDVQEKLGAKLPLDAAFVDENGKPVTLADYVGDKPVILTFNYSSCPMLCSVQLGGLVDTMLQMKWNL